MKVTRVSPTNIGLVWPQIEHFINSAFATELGDEDPVQVRKELSNGDAQLWVIHSASGIKAAGITRISIVPAGRRVCFCVALGGEDLPSWVEALDREASKFAKDYHCNSIRVTGRPGWKRVMKPLGYKESFVIVEKAL